MMYIYDEWIYPVLVMVVSGLAGWYGSIFILELLK